MRLDCLNNKLLSKHFLLLSAIGILSIYEDQVKQLLNVILDI